MIKSMIISFLISYMVLLGYAYFFADKIIFPIPPASYIDTQDIVKLITVDKRAISAIYLPNPQAKYTILFSHGNHEDIGTIKLLLKKFQQRGFAVFAYDYHGYGTSNGKPSELNAYYDINAAYNYLVNNLKIEPKQIIAFGFSIGSALAIDIASREKVGAVIVQGPFLTVYRVVTQIPLLPFDKFNNIEKIKKIKVPILIIHGTKDIVIPFWQGHKLYDLANTPKYNYWVNGAGHNNLIDLAGEKYWQTIENFVAKIRVDYEI